MKYKIGDMVRIREDLKPEKIYSRCYFNPQMARYMGNIYEIIGHNDIGHYELSGVVGWYWSDDMLEDGYYTDKNIQPMNTNLLPEGKESCCICSELHGISELKKDRHENFYCSLHSETLVECHECHEYFDTDSEGSHTSDDYYFCEGCEGDRVIFCSECENTYNGDNTNMHHYGDGYVCSSCYDNNFFSCHDCGDVIRMESSDEYSCSFCDVSVCQSCYEDRHCHDEEEEEEEFERRGASGEHRGEKAGKYLKVDRYIGVEIESEGGDKFQAKESIPEMCGISLDGSLNSTGVEVQTPPASLDKAEKIIGDACSALSSCGFSITHRCGLHVHIDAHDITRTKIIQVFKTMYAIEDVLYSMLPESRWKNHYCMPFRSRYSFDDLHKKMTTEQVEEAWYKDPSNINRMRRKRDRYDSTRYSGMNFHAYYTKKTIEFRQHSGTLNPTKILKWSAILLTIIDYAVNRYKAKNIEQLVYEPMSRKKAKKVMDEIGLSKPLQTYMFSRIMEHNPKYENIIGDPLGASCDIKIHAYHILEGCKTPEEIKNVCWKYWQIIFDMWDDGVLPSAIDGNDVANQLSAVKKERDYRPVDDRQTVMEIEYTPSF